jgi:hypothetical protein
MSSLPDLAAAAVTVLVPYLQTSATALAKKLGTTAAEHLTSRYEKVKARLTQSGKEALTDLEATPTDGDTQVTLRRQLTKQLPSDPDLQAVLIEMVEALRSGETAQVLQTSTIVGDHSTNIQISGSGNQVGRFGKSS